MRSSGRIAACARHGSSASSAAQRRRLAAATAATRSAFGAARAGARFVHVVQVRRRDRIAIEAHDRIGEIVPLVRAYPRLDRHATARRTRDNQQKHYVANHASASQKKYVKPPVNSILL